jgi:hypothetical protein
MFRLKSSALCIVSGLFAAVACGPTGNTNLNAANTNAIELTNGEDDAAPLGLAGVGDRVCRLNFAFLSKDAAGMHTVLGEFTHTDGVKRTGYGAGCLQFCAASFEELRKVNEPNGKHVFVKSCQFAEFDAPAGAEPAPAVGAAPAPADQAAAGGAAPAPADQAAAGGAAPAPVAAPAPAPAPAGVGGYPMPKPAPVQTKQDEKRCKIEAGSGEVLFSERLTRLNCASECQKRDQTNPQRECEWGSEKLRAHPKNVCSIVGGAGKKLYRESTIRFVCRMECKAREQSNPNRSCLWGAENVK